MNKKELKDALNGVRQFTYRQWHAYGKTFEHVLERHYPLVDQNKIMKKALEDIGNRTPFGDDYRADDMVDIAEEALKKVAEVKTTT